MPIISPQDDRWSQFLTSCPHDIYQIPGYSVLEAEALGGTPLAWYKSGRSGPVILIPLVERVIHSNGIFAKDLISPYGYPGLMYAESTTRDQYCEWIKEFHQEAADLGYVSSFLRLHPLYNTYQVRKQTGITQHAHGHTVSINLNLPRSEISQSYSYNHRRNLKHLRKGGFVVSINQWAQLPDFIRIYTQTMERKHAISRYFFKETYFNGLREMLNEDLIMVMARDDHEQQVAGGLFSIVNGLAQYHLGGTLDDFISKSPFKLILDSAVEYFKKRGAHTLHLGGGYGASDTDGLFRFKAGFGRQQHCFSTLRFIHRREIYNRLLKSQCHTQQSNRTYFPEYRFLGS